VGAVATVDGLQGSFTTGTLRHWADRPGTVLDDGEFLREYESLEKALNGGGL